MKRMARNLTNVAKALRKNSTEAEKFLWKYLKSRQMEGLKFRRQEPIKACIVDFICFENRLVIEVDGGGHAERIEQDRNRDMWLKDEGFRVLRFWNKDVLENIEGVIEVIREDSLRNFPLTPPIKGGG